MTEGSDTAGRPPEREPDGNQEAKTSSVGEPTRELEHGEQRAREEERPDLDERQSKISTRRKPMGPPLEDLEDADDIAREAAPEASPEPPTDPGEP